MDEAARRVLDDLKAFEASFLSLAYPGRDEEMIRQLKKILFRVSSSDSYLVEKKGKLERAADVWFSPRKWEQYPGGVSALRAVILGGINSVYREFEVLSGRK